MDPSNAGTNAENIAEQVPLPGQTIQPGGQVSAPVPQQPLASVQPVNPLPFPQQPLPQDFAQPISPPTLTQPTQPTLPQAPLSTTITTAPINPAPVTANFPAPITPPVPTPAVVAAGAFTPSTAQGPVVSGMVMGGDNTAPPPPSKFKFLNNKFLKSPIGIGILAAVLLSSSASAYYFGYYTNPSVVLSQSLSNTGKGYDKIITYFDQQSKVKYKGSEGKGTYTVTSDKKTTDGSYGFTTYGDNSDINVDIGYGTGRVKAEVRTIKAPSGTSPDIYLKATGLTGLGGLTGDANIDKGISQYENKWIVIDHTLLENLGTMVVAAPTSGSSADQNLPSEPQIIDELHAFGNVSKQYVFTTNKKTSVTTVLKTYGVETVDGHKAVHYKMGLDKDHIKQYIIAQQAALKTSKLNDWIKKSGSEQDVADTFKSMEDSTKDITSKDTFDLWADINTRLVYKIRVNDSSTKNAAANYVDVGLDYKGGSEFPFFISGQTKDDSSGNGTGTFVITINSKTHSLGLKVGGEWSGGGQSAGKLSANLTYAPTNNVNKIDTPTGATPLSKVLSDLGLSDLLNSYLDSAGTSFDSTTGSINGGIQDTATDSKRKADINSLQTQLEAFFSQNGNYPSFGEFNDASWRKVNMKSMDPNALQDPAGGNANLTTKPTAKVYSYDVTDDNGGSCEDDSTTCSMYTLTATLSDGTPYSVNQLD